MGLVVPRGAPRPLLCAGRAEPLQAEADPGWGVGRRVLGPRRRDEDGLLGVRPSSHGCRRLFRGPGYRVLHLLLRLRRGSSAGGVQRRAEVEGPARALPRPIPKLLADRVGPAGSRTDRPQGIDAGVAQMQGHWPAVSGKYYVLFLPLA